MAEATTPSAAAMSNADAPATAGAAGQRPTKPDDDAFKQKVAEFESKRDALRKKIADKQAQVTGSTPGSSAGNEREKEIRGELDTIKSRQASTKSSRTSKMDSIKALDAQQKTKFKELNAAKAKVPFPSTDAIDKEIARLDAQVESGKLKVVDEKKTLATIGDLRRQRRAFGTIDELQKDIEKLKARIADERKSLDDPESKAMQADFERLTKEMDQIRSGKQGQYKELHSRREELRKLKDEDQKLFGELKAFRDQHYDQVRSYRAYEREAAQARDARRKAERDAYFHQKRQQQLSQRLEEASTPAYTDEIRAAESLLRIVDPTFTTSTAAVGPGEFAAKAQRTVDDSGMKGTRLVRKAEEEDAYFVGTGGKKGKKNKKGRGQADVPSETSTSDNTDLGRLWAPGSLEQFGLLKLDPPASHDDIPNIVEQLKTKRQFFLDDRTRKTQENIDLARKEFEAHEAGSDTHADNQAAKKSRDPAEKTRATTNGTASAGEQPTIGNSEQSEKSVDEISKGVAGTAISEKSEDQKA